jgi:hypothetical protein
MKKMGFYKNHEFSNLVDWIFSMSGLISLGILALIIYGIYLTVNNKKSAKKDDERLSVYDRTMYDDFKSREEIQAEMREAREKEEAEIFTHEERGTYDNK